METEAGTPRSYGLRERKRTRTRLMIQTEALRLFDEKGYADTTVEAIADAAAISPRTFFRYFPTKEDVVLWDEFDPVAMDLLASVPDGMPLAETFRAVIRETLNGLYRQDPGRLLTRIRLIYTVPELRARFLDEQVGGVEMLVELFGGRRASRAELIRVRVVGSALLAAVSVALEVWQSDDGKSDLLALLDQATDALAASMSELEPGTRRRVARARR
jgi:AcrR family transcriptional regulator